MKNMMFVELEGRGEHNGLFWVSLIIFVVPHMNYQLAGCGGGDSKHTDPLLPPHISTKSGQYLLS